MANETSPNQNPDFPPSDNPPPVLTAEEILKNAHGILAVVTPLAEVAKTAIANANAACDSIKETQKAATEAATVVQTKLVEVTNTATQVVAAKTKISDDQAVIATKSEHIQKAQEHADAVRANLDRALTSATQQATSAEAQQAKAQAAADTDMVAKSSLACTSAKFSGIKMTNFPSASIKNKVGGRLPVPRKQYSA